MKLIVHAGTHKTATTAFQEICTRNRDLLKTHGVHYPVWEKRKNHGFLALNLRQREFGYIEKLFAGALRTCGPDSTILISGEGLERCFIDLRMATDLEAIARRTGIKDIEWIVVARKPYDYFQSLYGELSKQFMAMNYVEMADAILANGFLSASSKYYDYMFVFDGAKFYTEFPQITGSKLHVLPFKDFTSPYPGRVIFDAVLGKPALADDIALPVSEAQNARLEPRKIEFRYVCNFLRLPPTDDTYRANAALIDDLIGRRLAQIAGATDLEKRFAKRFQPSPVRAVWKRLTGRSGL